MTPSKIQRLQNGETFETSEKGNSMVPLIKSGQKHVLAPVKFDDVKVDDIVYSLGLQSRQTQRCIDR
jgi:hypothetical protein